MKEPEVFVRKNPEEFLAMQWDGTVEGFKDLAQWMMKTGKKARAEYVPEGTICYTFHEPRFPASGLSSRREHVRVVHADGSFAVMEGDWVVHLGYGSLETYSDGSFRGLFTSKV